MPSPRPQICMWEIFPFPLSREPRWWGGGGASFFFLFAVVFILLADCLITIAVKYPGSPVHSWFLDPLGQRVVIGLGLGTATLLLIKSPLGEASGAHMNPAITLTFF